MDVAMKELIERFPFKNGDYCECGNLDISSRELEIVYSMPPEIERLQTENKNLREALDALTIAYKTHQHKPEIIAKAANWDLLLRLPELPWEVSLSYISLLYDPHSGQWSTSPGMKTWSYEPEAALAAAFKEADNGK